MGSVLEMNLTLTLPVVLARKPRVSSLTSPLIEAEGQALEPLRATLARNLPVTRVSTALFAQRGVTVEFNAGRSQSLFRLQGARTRPRVQTCVTDVSHAPGVLH